MFVHEYNKTLNTKYGIKYDDKFEFINKKKKNYEFTKYPYKKDKTSNSYNVTKKKYKFGNYWLSIINQPNKIIIKCDIFFELIIVYNNNKIKLIDFFYNDIVYTDNIKLINFIKNITDKDYTCLFIYKFLKLNILSNSLCAIDKNNDIIIVNHKFIFKKCYDKINNKFKFYEGELENENILLNGAINLKIKDSMIEKPVITYFPQTNEAIYLKNQLMDNSNPYGTLIYMLDDMDVYYGYLLYGKKFNYIEKIVENKTKITDDYINNQNKFIKLNFKNILLTIFRIPSYSNETYNPFYKIKHLVNFNKLNKKNTINYTIKLNKYVFQIFQTTYNDNIKYVIKHFKKYNIGNNIKYNLITTDFHEYYNNELVDSYRLNNMLRLNYNFNITQKIYGYKLGLSSSGKPCIIKLEIPFNSYVVGSNNFKIFRCSKAIVRSIYKISKKEIDYNFLNKNKDKCESCLSNYSDVMTLPCKTLYCVYCCDKILEELNQCKLCKNNHQLMDNIEEFHIKYDDEVNKAYSFINFTIPIEYKKNHTIHSAYFDRNLSKSISNGIHFYLNPKYIENLFEIENLPKVLKKFHNYIDFNESNDIESELKYILLNTKNKSNTYTDKYNFDLSI